jgi:hypothetical protein
MMALSAKQRARQVARASETPVVPVQAHRAPSRVWTLTVPRCPFCKGTHTHGGGRGADPDGGPRLSRCESGASNYWLVVEQEETTHV